jgi:hypothetical protein
LVLFWRIKTPFINGLLPLLNSGFVVGSRVLFAGGFVILVFLAVDEEVADDVEHGGERLALGVLLHEQFDPEKGRELVLGHRHLGPGVLSHEHLVRLFKPVFFEELTD